MKGLVQLGNRNLSNPVPPYVPATVTLIPVSYSWHALGGPEQAVIDVAGSAEGIWEAIEWLRCPVTIWSKYNLSVWWGFVAEVEINYGVVSVGISLDSMANKVATIYSLVEPGTATVGERATTDWAEDADSQADYGIKELRISLSGATTAVAEAARAAMLAMRKYPVPEVRIAGGEMPSARLTCRGWWDTLSWRYYDQAGTDNTETTTQISQIVDAAGQFFTETEVEDASGISSSQYRAGDATALAEIEELLSAGTTNSRRLLATVTESRKLQVYEEPVSSSDDDHYLLADGRMRDNWNVKVELGTCPVAKWTRLLDVPPLTTDLSKIASLSPFFIERSEYDVNTGQLTLEPRGIQSPWQIGQVQAG